MERMQIDLVLLLRSTHRCRFTVLKASPASSPIYRPREQLQPVALHAATVESTRVEYHLKWISDLRLRARTDPLQSLLTQSVPPLEKPAAQAQRVRHSLPEKSEIGSYFSCSSISGLSGQGQKWGSYAHLFLGEAFTIASLPRAAAVMPKDIFSCLSKIVYARAVVDLSKGGKFWADKPSMASQDVLGNLVEELLRKRQEACSNVLDAERGRFCCWRGSHAVR